MKRKTIIGVTAALLLATASYSAAWYYGAYKIKEEIGSFVAANNQKKGNPYVTYSSIKVTGFPGAFDVTIFQPSIEQKKPEAGVNLLILKTEKLLLTANLLNHTYTGTVIDPITEQYEVRGMKQLLALQFNTPPSLEMQLKSLASWKRITKGEGLLEEIEALFYADKGMVIRDAASDNILVSQIEPVMIDLKSLPTEEGRIEINGKFSLQGVTLNPEYTKITYKLPGKLTGQGDVSFKGIKDTNPESKNKGSIFSSSTLNIKDISLTAGEITANAKGEMGISKLQYMPSGEIVIDVTHMQKLLQQLVLSNIIKDAPSATTALKKIAEKPLDDNTMKFVIRGNPNDVTVGKIVLPQVVALLKQLAHD